MPWLRAELRGKTVYARATEQGELAVEGGRVEIRYRPQDGRLYRAAARNLTIQTDELLPDDLCGPAEAVERTPNRRPAAQERPPRGPRGAAVPPGSLVVYTDGACSSNPGPAGLGVVVVRGDERVERSEYLGQATNNIAELTAVLRALEHIEEDQAAVIHTDSKYTIGVVQQGWKAKKNRELVATLRAELGRRPKVTLVYVPGHAGVPLNERADELAREAIAQMRSTTTVTHR
ncbi:MAG: ribonuclease HI [Deltaproteobacteria bacterium]|nr:ribonuclease HI [Deltaproteobacteria bacterium]MBW2532632.1 ribonuclease HI [Deltaproteobacteria bacterium]